MLEKTGNVINYFGKETGKIIEGASNKVADIGLVKNIIDTTNSGYSFVKRGSFKIIDGIDSTAGKVINYIKSNDENDNNNNNNDDENNNDDVNENKKDDDNKNNEENKDDDVDEIKKKEDKNDTIDILEKREFGIDDY